MEIMGFDQNIELKKKRFLRNENQHRMREVNLYESSVGLAVHVHTDRYEILFAAIIT
jgi:hypothetical protein